MCGQTETDAKEFPEDCSEYLSRWARWRLVCICVKALANRFSDERRGRRVSPVAAVASRLDVTERTVQRWVANGVQSCNVNAEGLVAFALECSPSEAGEILQVDLLRHVEVTNGLLAKSVESLRWRIRDAGGVSHAE